MATQKNKQTAVGQKAAAAIDSTRPASVRTPPAPRSGANPQQIIREAAWSRMFGRIEMKNPFTR